MPDLKVDVDEVAALMAFPSDELARKAFALYIRHDRAAAMGQSVVLSADEYLFLTSCADVSRPEIAQRAKTSTARGMAAAWPFVQMFLAPPDSKPSLAKAYRQAQELKETNYRATKHRLTEIYADLDSDRVDRKYFEEVRREFASVLHLWMAHMITNVATDRGPDVRDPQRLRAFLLGAERCAAYLASLQHANRHPPVDVSQLHRVPVPDN
ncbi:hypothetical protein QYH69_01440 [Paraburkholderia sp. SARCC-3016]|uniref:hypothetical protein n=1 Tax=Paraburkholderia sp. SARCC-3016 TaxID=3058611 RepID=UPI002807EB26|nr:hypothetical protein [Paraburkholderia sp. SARCC-3016]MDQ7975910.1 hypothetical protein [Paraburkholderia sp. SARCC-3016]